MFWLMEKKQKIKKKNRKKKKKKKRGNKKLNKKDIDELIKLIDKQVTHLELSSLNQSNNNFIVNLILILKDTKNLTTLNSIILKNYPTANILLNKDHNIAL